MAQYRYSPSIQSPHRLHGVLATGYRGGVWEGIQQRRGWREAAGAQEATENRGGHLRHWRGHGSEAAVGSLKSYSQNGDAIVQVGRLRS